MAGPGPDDTLIISTDRALLLVIRKEREEVFGRIP